MDKPRFKTIKQMEKEKLTAFTNWNNKVEHMYVTEMIKILYWFKKKFPKRRLKWWNGMGTHFWEIDGETFDCDTWIPDYRTNVGGQLLLKERPWTRKERLLAPLVNFALSFEDVTNMHPVGVCIGDYSTDQI